MTEDLRKFARQTNIRLLIGFILLLFLVGNTLIYVFYGQQAAILGFICLLAGIIPLSLIALILKIMEKIVERSQSS